ncbi:MAG: hypothetical protein A3G18_12485 [Rhodospirillales bacterium RIFCSPLOWO2_12_FULL_58_28]|nr:MAG: hypothetical protein A3H92_12495 [Rhodospirillales bacterium RIFCSPLOWO2_02_FULL_58_16]OHC79678.1 MAG: hypothetical protein A3G18_12485 [Rhodospirillales bacterium RIFCSPLOWO2_12_FULL_58_28]
MSINLYDYNKNIYSQNGEDGIIEKLLSVLNMTGGYFVEFGAWDGKHWSNAYHLYEKGWKGCFIEGDQKRFTRLCANIPDETVLKINALVEEDGDNSLDSLLQKRGVKDIDFLSVDIDSDDLRVWEGIKHFNPKIVIVEYNPVIPFDTRYINPKGKMNGNSALSIHESARSRGYVLIEGTNTNLIFVKPDIIKNTKIREKTLQEIKDQTFQLRYFFSQDGTLLHNYEKINNEGITELFPIPWSLSFGIQPVPKIFRKYYDRVNYGSVLFSFTAAIFRCPIQMFKLVSLFIKTIFHGRTLKKSLSLLMNKAALTKSLKE